MIKYPFLYKFLLYLSLVYFFICLILLIHNSPVELEPFLNGGEHIRAHLGVLLHPHADSAAQHSIAIWKFPLQHHPEPYLCIFPAQTLSPEP